MKARIGEAAQALLDADPYAVFLAYVAVVGVVLTVAVVVQWLGHDPVDGLLAEPDLEHNVASYDAQGREALR